MIVNLLPQRWLAVTAFFCAVFACMQCSSRDAPVAHSEPAANHYVNPRTCAGCHAAIWETYRHTGMARAFHSSSAATVPNTNRFYHRASDTWFQMIARDGVLYQRSWQIGYQGKEESLRELKVDYVMGSGNHVRTYLHRTARNTLIELPLAWYSDKGGGWAMNPGYDTEHPPTSRKVGYDCMFCHNGYPPIPSGHEDAGTEPVFQFPLPEGIDCQRCHGPGGEHVRTAQLPNAQRELIRAAIGNPARLDANRGVEVCLQCHLETTSFGLPNAIRRFDRGPYSYRPGEPLASYILYFDHPPSAGKDEKFEIVSSAYRLRKSQCYLRSNGALTCTTCHNPHDIPHGPVATERYNGVCRQCHSGHKQALVEAKKHSSDTNCIACHMPKRRTEDVVHAVMTDHRILRRPPAGDLLAELKERHGKDAEYRGEVVPYGESDDLYTAVAQVSAKSNVDAGIPRLEAAIAQRQPKRAEFFLELGDALQFRGNFGRAAEVYRQALARRPDSAMMLRRLADALRSSGQTQAAYDTLVHATKLGPANAEAWYDLGLLESDLGKKTEALASLRQATELDPDFADAQNSLGAVLAETGQADLAEAAFREALRIQPALSGARANLANLLASKGNLPEAVWHYEKADAKARDQFNYGVTLARMNRLPEARKHLEAALKDDPNLAEAHHVLGGLLETQGLTDDALLHYREAVRLRPAFGKAHLDLGVVLANRHQLAAAAAEFRLAAADPDADVRLQASRALQAIGSR